MSNDGRATESALADLHGHLAREFTRIIREGNANPAALNAARQFLKDNGISCDGERSPEIGSLVDALPDEIDEDSAWQ